jgi:hypothetical protein
MNSSVKPDFSGEWVLDRRASHLTGGASAMETGILRIDHRDPKCGFQISMSAGGESVERAWESSLSAEISIVDSGFYSRLFWEGDALVFECGSKGADETWSMKNSTLAILVHNGQHLPLTVPLGGVVQVAAGRLNENQLVDVEWQGKPLMMFAVDLRDRGELVYGDA